MRNEHESVTGFGLFTVSEEVVDSTAGVSEVIAVETVEVPVGDGLFLWAFQAIYPSGNWDLRIIINCRIRIDEFGDDLFEMLRRE